MADRPRHPDAADDTGTDGDPGAGPDREPAAGAPSWVKVFWITGIVLVVLFVALHLSGMSPVGH